MINSIIDIEKLSTVRLDSLSELIVEPEFRKYFLDDPGKEHYTLLAHISTLFNNSVLLDIGTYKGCSALALSMNSSNQIKSFDIRHGLRRILDTPDNVEFIVDNVIDEQYKDLVISSNFIILDTEHDGFFENEFYKYLKTIDWKGVLLLDDIYYNQSMTDFWNNIVDEKFDITHIGHHSGTGLVIFK